AFQSTATPRDHKVPAAAAIPSHEVLPSVEAREAPAGIEIAAAIFAPRGSCCRTSVLNVSPAPVSSKISNPFWISVLAAALKFTGTRLCRAQYSGEVASASV